MKKFLLIGVMMYSMLSLAQIEQDDLYFNKKDRAKLAEANTRPSDIVARAEKPLRFDYPVKPATEISRNVNPEHISRSESEAIAGEQEDYFIENYEYTNRNNLNNFNNNLNQWNANSIYSNSYFAPSIYGWNSPYYSPFNDPFLMGYNTNPWCNPYYSSGWSVSFSLFWGNPWNYGWGNSFGVWNGYWGSPWYNGFYNNYYRGWYPSSTIIVADNNYRRPVYGKRNTRSGQWINTNNSGSRSNATITAPVGNSSTGNGSRSNSRTQEYYTPQWRRVTQQPNRDYSPSQNRVNSGRTSGNDFLNNRSSGTPQRSGGYSSPSPSRGSSPGSGSRSSRSRGN